MVVSSACFVPWWNNRFFGVVLAEEDGRAAVVFKKEINIARKGEGRKEGRKEGRTDG
jgi:hypothetical protein